MKELFVATTNKGKLKEIAAILDRTVERLVSPAEFPQLPTVNEDGDTFEANAIKKARSAADATGLPAIADDSGLVAMGLGGRPGVHSARFAGEDATDEGNIRKLLAELADNEHLDRSAYFACVIALCLPGGECRTFSGRLDGVIIDECRGVNGFGYDPVFWLPQFSRTLAELDTERKNMLSHRAQALGKLKEYLATCSE